MINVSSSLTVNEGKTIQIENIPETIEQRIRNVEMDKVANEINVERCTDILDECMDKRDEIEEEETESHDLRSTFEEDMKAYENHVAVFECSTQNFDYNIQEIEINPKSVTIEVCNEGDRPGAKINLITVGVTSSAFWGVSDFKQKYDGKQSAWVQFEFKKPQLVRGYGIRCGPECAERDPSEFKLLGIDMLKNEETGQKWSQLHGVKNCQWKKRGQLQKFNFKQRLLTKIKLKISKNCGDDQMQIGQFKIYC